MTFDEMKRSTAVHMDDPRPGDRFHEMLTFWVEVAYRDGDRLLYFTVNERDVPTLSTVDEFRRQFAYGSIPGYWVLYCDGNGDVLDEAAGRRWMAEIEAAGLRRLAAASLDSACL